MAEQEYWRWTEYRHHDESIDPKRGAIVAAGIDVGSVSSQAVIAVDDRLYAFSSMRTGSNSPDTAALLSAFGGPALGRIGGGGLDVAQLASSQLASSLTAGHHIEGVLRSGEH